MNLCSYDYGQSVYFSFLIIFLASSLLILLPLQLYCTLPLEELDCSHFMLFILLMLVMIVQAVIPVKEIVERISALDIFDWFIFVEF